MSLWRHIFNFVFFKDKWYTLFYIQIIRLQLRFWDQKQAALQTIFFCFAFSSGVHLKVSLQTTWTVSLILCSMFYATVIKLSGYNLSISCCDHFYLNSWTNHKTFLSFILAVLLVWERVIDKNSILFCA